MVTSRSSLAGKAFLAAGDVGVLLLFTLIGLRNHELAPTEEIFLRTFAPLAIVWLLLGPVLGVFNSRVTASAFETGWRVSLSWLLSGTIALLLRSWLFDRPLIPAFMAVVLVGNGLLLLIWRFVHLFGFRRLAQNTVES